MSGRARLALCAAAATLMASCAMLPLVSPATWIFQAAFLLAVQTGVGALTRRVPLARPLTVAAQALVTLMLLTLVFARQQAVAVIVPGPEVFQHFGTLLQAGADDVGRYSIPAPLSDGIRLMVVGGVLVIGLAVDALAVTYRSAAPAGLPLLALYSVAAGLSGGGAAWLWFLLAAAGYLMLLLAEGRDRLSQWGRVFGGSGGSGAAARSPESTSGAVAPVRTGRRIGAVALGIALFVPLALPSFDGGLLGAAGRGVGNGTGDGGTISAVNPVVSLRDSLNVNEDRTVMTYRTNTSETQDLYLRIVSLDDFDGTAWTPTQRHIVDVPKTFPAPIGLSGQVKRATIQTRISAADWYAQDWLPMPYPASKVDINGSWRYEPVGRALVGDHGQNTRGVQYQVTSLMVEPTAQQLASAPEPSPAMRREFTKVPESLPAVVARTARKVTAGSANHYEQAVKLQDYFAVSGNFQYNTQVQAGSGSTAIANFLKEKQGFCVHFSFAMASMARTLGIPARVAVGFTPGTPQADGSMSVGLRDAHAWPELYFEGVGWTRFEPTPSRGTVPSYTQTNTPGNTEPVAPKPTFSTSAAPSTAPSASESCSTQLRKLAACPSQSSAAAVGTQDDDWFGFRTLGLTLAGLLILGVPLLPMLWRMRVRAARLGGHGRAEADVAAYTLRAWLEVTDTAWDHGIPPEESQTPRKAAERIIGLGELDPEAAAAVHRLAAAVEQVLYAPRPRQVAGLANDARRVAEAFGTSASRPARLRALLAPRSSVRVMWSVSAALTSLRTRLSARRQALLRRPSGQNG
ncbi:transglutaminase family protein [Streptomyces sp. NBC_00358]|uniref:transglutaminase family protein n=1 Tax=Streptomyces sp. NBC_00358 TaxID=2975725 RepID=UPI002E266E6A